MVSKNNTNIIIKQSLKYSAKRFSDIIVIAVIGFKISSIFALLKKLLNIIDINDKSNIKIIVARTAFLLSKNTDNVQHIIPKNVPEYVSATIYFIKYPIHSIPGSSLQDIPQSRSNVIQYPAPKTACLPIIENILFKKNIFFDLIL